MIILVDNELTSEIPYTNGVKQGCILAPTIFAIFAAALFMRAFSDSPPGVSYPLSLEWIAFQPGSSPITIQMYDNLAARVSVRR